MWIERNKINNYSILRVGSALILAAVLVISTIAYSFGTSADGNRNSPPYPPSNPFPTNGSVNVSIMAQLSWTGGDPDNDTVTYNVFFGTNQTPGQVATNISTTTYNPGTMNFSTNYYWKIIAWDNQSQSTAGPLWEFTTRANHPPYEPNTPDPANGSTNVSVIAQLSWMGGDPDNDTVTYNVFFGTNQTPGQVATNISTTTYNPGTMNFSTNYYWKIIAWDNHSASTQGPLWMFTTVKKPTTITISFAKPLNNTFYFRDQPLLFKLPKRTIIYGSITITANVTADAGVAMVDFYIDGKYMGNDTTEPYTLVWNPRIQFNGLSLTHTIKVIAFDKDGKNATAEINVTKWRFHILPALIIAAGVISSAIPHTTMKGFVFNLRETTTGYTFFAIRMHYHTISLIQNSRGVIQMKRCAARVVIGPITIIRLGPLHTFAYLSITFVGGVHIETNPVGGILSRLLQPPDKSDC